MGEGHSTFTVTALLESIDCVSALLESIINVCECSIREYRSVPCQLRSRVVGAFPPKTPHAGSTSVMYYLLFVKIYSENVHVAIAHTIILLKMYH